MRSRSSAGVLRRSVSSSVTVRRAAPGGPAGHRSITSTGSGASLAAAAVETAALINRPEPSRVRRSSAMVAALGVQRPVGEVAEPRGPAARHKDPWPQTEEVVGGVVVVAADLHLHVE